MHIHSLHIIRIYYDKKQRGGSMRATIHPKEMTNVYRVVTSMMAKGRIGT